MSEARLIASKACALLLPSPFAWFDPAGEPARQAELLAWLGSAGVDLGQVDRAHLAACAIEAHDALIPPPGRAGLPEGGSVPPLRHPLSAETLPRRRREFEPAALHAHLLGALTQLNGAPDGRWYRHLWRALMRHKAYRELPADPRIPDHTVAAHRSLTAAIAGATLGGDRPALLALHVGPVQSFIEAARRTHDLFIGSYTVAFLAFAAARILAEELGPDVLVYPDVSNRPLADQLIFDDPPDGDDRSKLLRAALVNRIMAVLPDRRADELARRAAQAVAETWRAMAGATKDHLERRCDLAMGPGFDAQIEAHLDIDLVVQHWPRTNDEITGLLGDAGLLHDHAGAPLHAWLEEPEDHPGAACGALIDLTERTLVAHRRTLRPAGREGDSRPKCTICGAREQMGPRAEERWRQQAESRRFFETLSEQLQRTGQQREDERGSLQIVHGEGLCAVCLTKRFAPEIYYGDTAGPLGLDWIRRDDRPLLRFPSTATIASAPLRLYLQQVSERDREIRSWLDRLQDLHRGDRLAFTPPGNLLAGLGPVGAGSRLLAHDGTWLYESTYEPGVIWRNHFAFEPDRQPERYQRIEGLVGEARRAFARARGTVDGKSASPYYAVIVLDGDEMGDWKAGQHRRSPTLGELASLADNDPLAHRRRPVHPALYGELSRRVADLGIDLHRIVDRHLGRLVYYGGDDLLALVPLATALPCLEEMRLSIQAPEHLGNRVTISAGMAVSHWRDPLGGALEAARQAEQSAKRAGRDRFAIHADKRSGETLKLVLPWTMTPRELGRLPMIPTLCGMLARGGGKAPPLAGTKAAYRLREELPSIGHPDLGDAFLQRIRTLLFSGRAGTDEAGAPEDDGIRTLDALLSALLFEKGVRFEAAATRIVDLLLFLRFLLREEHGIVIAELLRDLPEKGAMP